MRVWIVEAKFTHQEQPDLNVSLTKKFDVARAEEALGAFYDDLDKTGLQEELELMEVNTTSVVEADVVFQERTEGDWRTGDAV